MNKSIFLIRIGCLFSVLPTTAWAQKALELGIDRSNLLNLSVPSQEKTLNDIHALHAIWFRDGLGGGTTPEDIAKNVNLVKLVKQNHLKMLAIAGPTWKDYPKGYKNPNAGEAFKKICGWPDGSPELSKVDLNKYAHRLDAMLSAIKSANLTIDAFEVGNEYDWTCFNGDVVHGNALSDNELNVIVRAYGNVLKTGVPIMRHHFAQAKIITFGLAHASGARSARILLMLRDFNGFNYLDNNSYHVDGYGSHIYPSSNHIAKSVQNTLESDKNVVGANKPFWITEWGFQQKKDFPNKDGLSLAQGIEEMLATFQKESRQVALGPIMFYRYDYWLAEEPGLLLPEAFTLARFARRQ